MLVFFCLNTEPVKTLHTLYVDFSIVIDCTFVLCVTLCCCFLSHCFALSWPGCSCKLELVLNWPTWLNKGEIIILF